MHLQPGPPFTRPEAARRSMLVVQCRRGALIERHTGQLSSAAATSARRDFPDAALLLVNYLSNGRLGQAS